MAFTGVAVVKQLTDNLVRVTGLSLALGASGTFGLTGGAGAVTLPDAFNPQPYAWPAGVTVSLIESIQVLVNPATELSGFARPIRVVKTGATVALFLITFTNDMAAGDFSAELEIYVRFH